MIKKSKFLFILLSVLLSFNLHANETVKIKTMTGAGDAVVETVCVKGYLFAVVLSIRGVAITQMLKNPTTANAPLTAIECKIKLPPPVVP
jgi:hypothetical protein